MCCACGRSAGDRIIDPSLCSYDTTCYEEDCVPFNFGYDCSEDAQCEGDDVFCLDSICRKFGDIGDFCSSDEACEEDLICEMGACSALLSLGDSCTLFNRCETGLVCVDTCKEPGYARERCLFDSQCQPGLECLDSVCVDPEKVPSDVQIKHVKDVIERETGWRDVRIQDFESISQTNFAIKFVAIAPGYFVRYGFAKVSIPDESV